MKKILQYISLFFILLKGSTQLYGQYDQLYAQLIKSVEFINPAYNASKSNAGAIIFYRTPFIENDLIQSPNYSNEMFYSTMGVNAYYPFRYQHLGIGLNIIKESIAHRDAMFVDFSTNVDVRISSTKYLAFGLSGGMNLIQYNLNNALSSYTEGFSNDYNRQDPHIAFGGTLFGEHLNLGASLHTVIFNKSKVNYNIQENEMYTMYLNGSYLLFAGQNFQLKPSAFYRQQFKNGSDLISFEYGAYFLVKDWFWLGASQRLTSSEKVMYSISFDFKVATFIRLGYNFETSTASVKSINSNIHEFRIQITAPYSLKDKYIAQNF